MGGTFTLFLWIKHQQGHAAVAFGDILLPNRWHHFQAAKGRSLIAKSLIQFETGNAAAGFHNLRLGLTRYPASREGRLLLAQLYADNQRPDLARELLVNGLTHHPRDPAYARIVFAYLLNVQKDAKVIELADHIRQSPLMAEALGEMAGMAAATACYQRGYYDRAERYLATTGLANNRDSRLLRARIQWERGYADLALHLVRDLAADFPDDEEVYALGSSFLRQSGRFAEAHRLSLIFQLRRPDSALPRIDRLHAHVREGDFAALRQTTDELLHHFAGDEKILLALGDFAATTGDAALARQVSDRLPASSAAKPGAAVLTLEALITAKDYPAALTQADELTAGTPALDEPLLTLCHGLKAIAHYGSNDPGAGFLAYSRFVAGPALRSGNLLMISNLLHDAGASKPARDLLIRTAADDPKNQAVLSRLIELDLELNHLEALPARLRQLVTMRKPSRELLARAAKVLGSDRWLFTAERHPALEAIRDHLKLNRPTASAQLNCDQLPL
ncbi:MAG: hypothetical protein IPN11_17340 [Opitutaceae bacterium]|nr:hypothetical protein [Opitutaceae bacterium]